MAVNLPGSQLVIPPERFARGRDVLSGDDANSHTFGHRGLVSQTNYAFATRLRTVGGFRPYDGTEIHSNTSLTQTHATGYQRFHLAEDVVALRLEADCLNATLQLQTSQGNSGTDSNLLGIRAILSVDFTIVTQGATLNVRPRLARIALAAEGFIYSYQIYEVALTSGQFP